MFFVACGRMLVFDWGGILGQMNGLRADCENVSATFKAKAWLAYSFFALASAVFMAFSALLSAVLAPFAETRRRVVSWLLKNMLGALVLKGFVRAKCYGLEVFGSAEAAKGKGKIFVSNHTSILDPLILLSLVPNAGVLVKSRYKSWLVVRFLIKCLNFAVVDEHSKQSIVSAEKEMESLLLGGGNVIIFPEGTRSPDGRMRQFRKLAFKLAKNLDIQVVPVAVLSKYAFLSKGGKWFYPPEGNIFKVKFLEGILPKNFKSAAELSDAAFDAISKSFSEMSIKWRKKQ